MQRSLAALALVLTACRAAPPPADAAPSEVVPAGFRRESVLDVSLLVPDRWTRSPESPAADEAGRRMAMFEAKWSEESPTSASGRIFVLRLARGESWDEATGAMGWTRLPGGTGDRASFEAKVADPFAHSDVIRAFVNDGAFVLLECEHVSAAQRKICDEQLARLHLHGEAKGGKDVVEGPGFGFEPPPGFARTPYAGDDAGNAPLAFTDPARPGLRISVAGLRLAKKEPPDVTLDRYRALVTSAKDGGAVASAEKRTLLGCPAIEIVTTRPGDEVPTVMKARRLARPEGDALVGCQVQKLAELEELCEKILASAQDVAIDRR